MRNANLNDILAIKLGKEVPFNVMFYHPELGLVHRKPSSTLQRYISPLYITVEGSDGVWCDIAEKSALQLVPKKQGTPQKPKKPHVKGEKPWLGYQAHRIKDGVKVKTRNGRVYTVDFSCGKNKSSSNHCLSEYYWLSFFNIENGKHKNGCKDFDIVQILDNPVAQEQPVTKQHYSIGDVFDVDANIYVLVSCSGSTVNLIGDNGGRGGDPEEHNGSFTQIPYETVEKLVWNACYDMTEVKYLGKFSDVFERKNIV